MSRPRFPADHDLDEHIVLGFLRREPAAVFLRLRDIGMSGRPDAEVLEYAAREQLIVVSHDVNTMPAHAYSRIRDGRPVAGILMVRQSEPVGIVIDDLIAIWATTEAEEWNDLVCFIPLR